MQTYLPADIFKELVELYKDNDQENEVANATGQHVSHEAFKRPSTEGENGTKVH